jgi:O-antigen ligase
LAGNLIDLSYDSSMFLTKKLSIYKFIIYSAVLVTLAATPNFNKDSLIIPKVIILLCSALFVLPYLLISMKANGGTRLINIFKLLLLLFVIQLVFAMAFSDAPIEQQIFGRIGRGLGFITIFSLIIISLSCAIFVKQSDQKILIAGLAISGVLSVTYGIFQSFGLDFFPWDSKTNGVIGTLGNPNFVSSFAAMSILPSLIFMVGKSRKILYQLLLFLLFIFAIYRAQSTQGYITLVITLTVFALIYLWFWSKLFFSVVLGMFLISIFFVVSGFLNNGPLSKIIYKVSVQSRGEFWQSALNTANANPIFGVGLDSFGDYSLLFREQKVIGEYTDSAHNYILDLAVSGGYPLALLYILIILTTLLSFFKLQKNLGVFNPTIAALFAIFVVFQAQSLISPINIPILIWGMVISGSIIGLASSKERIDYSVSKKTKTKLSLLSLTSLFISLVIIFPYFNSDRLQLIAMNKGDGDLAIKVAKMYPESVIRYSTLTRALLDSGLTAPALDLARSAVEFNPNSPALWALLLINPAAPIAERREAKVKLLILDPLNEKVKNYEIK